MEQNLTYQAFQQALRENKFLGLKCNCGTYIAPPQIVCPECGGEELQIVEFKGKGKIKTFTVIRVAPEGFEAPYIVGMAELDEGPWIMGNIIGISPDEADMRLIGRQVKIGYKVSPADKFSAGEKVAMTLILS